MTAPCICNRSGEYGPQYGLPPSYLPTLAQGCSIHRAMTVGSLFSGIGGFDLGLERAGMEIVWQAEIDPFCNKVLAAHWPEVKRYGDVRDISSKSWAGPFTAKGQHTTGQFGSKSSRRGQLVSNRNGFAVDLICGGFPCQDLSVAGKRAGLDGDRSGLWFEFKRILSELRPTWAIVENVPGLLSSNQGRDFAIVLNGLVECGFGGVGWRVLDSQFWGVAQRRRRVYVVAGPSRRSVEQVLSLCESCGGHPQTRRAPGEDLAATIRGRSSGAGVNEPGRGGEDDSNLVLANPLLAKGGSGRSDYESETFVAHSLRADGFDASEDGTGRGTPLVFAERTRDGEANLEIQEGLSYALTNPAGGGRSPSRQLYDGAAVRRLTPTECERLQGFPDNWTLIDGAKDGPRYRALGNAVTVPVIEYLGHRISELKA